MGEGMVKTTICVPRCTWWTWQVRQGGRFQEAGASCPHDVPHGCLAVVAAAVLACLCVEMYWRVRAVLSPCHPHVPAKLPMLLFPQPMCAGPPPKHRAHLGPAHTHTTCALRALSSPLRPMQAANVLSAPGLWGSGWLRASISTRGCWRSATSSTPCLRARRMCLTATPSSHACCRWACCVCVCGGWVEVTGWGALVFAVCGWAGGLGIGKLRGWLGCRNLPILLALGVVREGLL